jgi:hypothetical protein
LTFKKHHFNARENREERVRHLYLLQRTTVN